MAAMISRPTFLLNLIGTLFPPRETDADLNRTDPTEPHVAEQERRDYLHEVMSRNPDAFGSDLDIEFMLSRFPGQF